MYLLSYARSCRITQKLFDISSLSAVMHYILLWQQPELDGDFHIQIYRTALDALLSWLNSVDNALERKLFCAAVSAKLDTQFST